MQKGPQSEEEAVERPSSGREHGNLKNWIKPSMPGKWRSARVMQAEVWVVDGAREKFTVPVAVIRNV